jgi:pSer/pThr/pTyr-binding forkhead associated (FHA) protein
MGIWLVMKTMDGSERPFKVRPERTIIGRETRCDVRIPIPSVSDRHCELHFDGMELRLSDLDSDLGTFHNGKRVREAILAHSDTLTVGPVTFVVRMEPAAISVCATGAPPVQSRPLPVVD